jgi:hypothetical protein
VKGGSAGELVCAQADEWVSVACGWACGLLVCASAGLRRKNKAFGTSRVWRAGCTSVEGLLLLLLHHLELGSLCLHLLHSRLDLGKVGLLSGEHNRETRMSDIG